MRGVKFILPAIVLIGLTIFQSLFIVQEISQAIVLQFGDSKCSLFRQKNFKFR